MLSGTIYYMDIMQKRRDEVIRFLRDHDKSYTQESGAMTEETVQVHLDLINKYLKDEVQLSWSPDGALDMIAV